jgi:hypothetical protein
MRAVHDLIPDLILVYQTQAQLMQTHRWIATTCICCTCRQRGQWLPVMAMCLVR